MLIKSYLDLISNFICLVFFFNGYKKKLIMHRF